VRALVGVEDFRFHDLRHEYESRLGDADVNLKKIARLMGHSDTKMTEHYVHPDEDSRSRRRRSRSSGGPESFRRS
jgi:integrase